MQINYSSTAANSGEEAEEVELLTPQAPYTIESTYLYKFGRLDVNIAILFLNFVFKLKNMLYFHDIELGIAKKIKGLAGKVQMLQKMFEKSLLLASLWAGLALIMALLFLVIIAGRH
jgi:hypothetical protein